MPDVWIVVFDFMPVKELLSVSRTCREMWLLVKAYWPLAFNLARVLQPFLMPDDVPSFRHMLKASGAVVSGSAALQFLDRVFYPSSDLDIYVSHANVEVAELWLLDHGMTKVPPAEDPDATPLGYNRPLVAALAYELVDTYQAFSPVRRTQLRS